MYNTLTFKRVLFSVLLFTTSLNLFAQNQIDTLYFVCDQSNTLWYFDRATGNTGEIGGTGVDLIEATAIIPSQNGYEMYATNSGDFGTLDPNTGTFTSLGEVDGGGCANGSAGCQTLNDVDGLGTDALTGLLWATERNSASPDILFVIDPATGQFIPDYFGAGIDYIEISGTGIAPDIDDVTVNPCTGVVYMSGTATGGNSAIVTYDPVTGVIANAGTLDISDVEGIGFRNDCILYGVSGTNNGLYDISMVDFTTTAWGAGLPSSCGDPEAMSALNAPGNLIQGSVWEDTNGDQNIDGTEIDLTGVTVNLYFDKNCDGTIDANESTPVQTASTDANGDYEMEVFTQGCFIIDIVEATLPSGYEMTTDNVETVEFTDFGQIDTDNDFGAREVLLPVELVKFEVEKREEATIIAWATGAEVNSKEFLIERSQDGIRFERIGTIQSLGSSNNAYAFIDNNPIGGLNYYRLKMIDNDYTFEYSEIKSLEFGIDTDVELEVYPNPTTDLLKFNLRGMENVEINLFNINGRLVNSIKLTQVAYTEIDVTNLTAGMYVVQVSDQKGNRFSERIQISK